MILPSSSNFLHCLLRIFRTIQEISLEVNTLSHSLCNKCIPEEILLSYSLQVIQECLVQKISYKGRATSRSFQCKTWQSSHPFHLAINTNSCESAKQRGVICFSHLLFISICPFTLLYAVAFAFPCLHLAIIVSFPLVPSVQAVLDLAHLLH